MCLSYSYLNRNLRITTDDCQNCDALRVLQANLGLKDTPTFKENRCHTHSKFVSLGKSKAIRQSGVLGAIDSMEHTSGEYGRMKRSLAQIDFEAGIFITPAHSLCFKYDMKS